MNKIACPCHADIRPTLVRCGTQYYGKEMVCLRCGNMYTFGKGVIAEVLPTYGFIALAGGHRLFFHNNNLSCVPRVGQSVVYEVGFTDRGPQAINVKEVADGQ